MKKKVLTTKLIVFILIVLLLPAVIVGCNKKSQSKNPNEIVVDKDLNEKFGKDSKVDKANVYSQGDNVLATIVLKSNVKDEDAKKAANEYADKLKEKYKDKAIDVQIIKNGNNFITVTRNDELRKNANKPVEQVKNSADMPKFTVKVENGLTVTNRYVAVTLETPTPEKYKVSVLGKELKYVAEKKVFHNVIESANEEQIKASVKIELIK